MWTMGLMVVDIGQPEVAFDIGDLHTTVYDVHRWIAGASLFFATLCGILETMTNEG